MCRWQVLHSIIYLKGGTSLLGSSIDALNWKINVQLTGQDITFPSINKQFNQQKLNIKSLTNCPTKQQDINQLFKSFTFTEY
jgi:hypothetical protein